MASNTIRDETCNVAAKNHHLKQKQKMNESQWKFGQNMGRCFFEKVQQPEKYKKYLPTWKYLICNAKSAKWTPY